MFESCDNFFINILSVVLAIVNVETIGRSVAISFLGIIVIEVAPQSTWPNSCSKH